MEMLSSIIGIMLSPIVAVVTISNASQKLISGKNIKRTNNPTTIKAIDPSIEYCLYHLCLPKFIPIIAEAVSLKDNIIQDGTAYSSGKI
jgi:hypothetical protein